MKMTRYFPIISVAVLLSGCSSLDISVKDFLGGGMVKEEPLMACMYPNLKTSLDADSVLLNIQKSFGKSVDGMQQSFYPRSIPKLSPFEKYGIQRKDIVYFVKRNHYYYEVSDYVTATRILKFRLIKNDYGTNISYMAIGFPDTCEEVYDVLRRYIANGEDIKPRNRGRKTMG